METIGKHAIGYIRTSYLLVLIFLFGYTVLIIFNPRRTCAARVAVVGSVCLSPMERLFSLKTPSCTQRATKVKNFVGFSLKMLRC